MEDRIGITQLRHQTCGYLYRVAAGETIGIIRRGKLVAWIGSIPSGHNEQRIAARATHAATRNIGVPIPLSQLRSQAGRCFDRVAAGQTFVVIHRGELLARIVSAQQSPETVLAPTG